MGGSLGGLANGCMTWSHLTTVLASPTPYSARLQEFVCSPSRDPLYATIEKGGFGSDVA